MATNDLTGNIATEALIGFLNTKGEHLALNMDKWQEAMTLSGKIFG
jgi:hydroxymethylglutaryl-CoA lyase